MSRRTKNKWFKMAGLVLIGVACATAIKSLIGKVSPQVADMLDQADQTTSSTIS